MGSNLGFVSMTNLQKHHRMKIEIVTDLIWCSNHNGDKENTLQFNMNARISVRLNSYMHPFLAHSNHHFSIILIILLKAHLFSSFLCHRRPIYSLHSCATAAQAQLRPFLTRSITEKYDKNKKNLGAHRNQTHYLCLRQSNPTTALGICMCLISTKIHFIQTNPKLEKNMVRREFEPKTSATG